ncbi:DUF4282 domain-containing protein [Cardiobacteriaceae bacterium TAE3-ERU3]|nr:DUF4282 domain-containing protein [Cardiobacteriaceae bacterium TAE3-ERU3]
MLKSLFTFDKFITPRAIVVLYWLIIIFSVLGGIGLMFSGMGSRYGGGFTFAGFLSGLFSIILGIIMARVWCELIMIFFRINENLEAIRDKNKL